MIEELESIKTQLWPVCPSGVQSTGHGVSDDGSLPPKHCYSMWCYEKRWQPTSRKLSPFLGAVTWADVSGSFFWTNMLGWTFPSASRGTGEHRYFKSSTSGGEYKRILQNWQIGSRKDLLKIRTSPGKGPIAKSSSCLNCTMIPHGGSGKNYTEKTKCLKAVFPAATSFCQAWWEFHRTGEIKNRKSTEYWKLLHKYFKEVFYFYLFILKIWFIYLFGC